MTKVPARLSWDKLYLRHGGLLLLTALLLGASHAPSGEAVRTQPTASRKTAVSIVGDEFQINGRPTYAGRVWGGHKIQELLLNSRLVQGIFDDRNPETVKNWAYRMKGEGFDAGYQSVPVNWAISSERKRGFFELLSKITGANSGQPQPP